MKRSVLLFMLALPSLSHANSELEALKNMTPETSQAQFKVLASTARDSSMKEAALSVGAQGGAKWQTQRIAAILDKHASKIDSLFAFGPLMIEGKVLPPVVAEVPKTTRGQSDGQALKYVDMTLIIERGAYLPTTTPTWRSWIYPEVIEPSPQSSAVLPKTDTERANWSAWVGEGWSWGAKLANQRFFDKISRFEHEYIGMIRFKILERSNILSLPRVGVGEYGIVQDGNELKIGQSEIRITQQSGFNRSKDWEAITPLLSELPEIKTLDLSSEGLLQ